MLKDFFTKKKYADLSYPEKKESKESSSKKDKNSPHTFYDKIKDSRLGPRERIDLIVDQGTFVEHDFQMKSSNPIAFEGYDDKISKAKEASGEVEALVSGLGEINGQRAIICLMNPNFMMGSMGSVVGEKISRAGEKALEERLPIIIFSASGGARMQEGMLSLMQMAKTSAVLGKLDEEGILYISVLTDPTTGGVTASFAMLGDIILAEPGVLVGFAGPRVIEQTIKESLPEGFQRAEFLLEKGFIDKIVERENLKDSLSKLLQLHQLGGIKDV